MMTLEADEQFHTDCSSQNHLKSQTAISFYFFGKMVYLNRPHKGTTGCIIQQ